MVKSNTNQGQKMNAIEAKIATMTETQIVDGLRYMGDTFSGATPSVKFAPSFFVLSRITAGQITAPTSWTLNSSGVPNGSQMFTP